MFTCGIDVGSRATKAIVLSGERSGCGSRFQAYRRKAGRIRRGGVQSGASRRESEEGRCRQARNDRVWAEAGRRRACRVQSGSCYAAGAKHLFPNTRNVLDVGALRSAAIRLDEAGNVHRFRLNDRCGAGVGRYLERVADNRGSAGGDRAARAILKDPKAVPGICSVLAESEVLSLITCNCKPADILKGVYNALAGRLAALLEENLDSESGNDADWRGGEERGNGRGAGGSSGDQAGCRARRGIRGSDRGGIAGGENIQSRNLVARQFLSPDSIPDKLFHYSCFDKIEKFD